MLWQYKINETLSLFNETFSMQETNKKFRSNYTNIEYKWCFIFYFKF